MKNKIASYELLSVYIVIVAVLSSCQKNTNSINSTESLLSAMKNTYDGKWFKNYTFKQLTIRYDEQGKVTDSTMWYESIGYPDFFRIDRDIEQKNYVIYRNDSTYNFRNGELYESLDKPAKHLLFKGGLYFMSLNESLEKLKKFKYNIKKFRKDSFHDEPAYVVGDSISQFWIHATHFYCMRRIYTTENGKQVDVVYDDFKKLDSGWVEQKVTFYVDGVEMLNEFYKEVKTQADYNPMIYDIDSDYEWYLKLYKNEK